MWSRPDKIKNGNLTKDLIFIDKTDQTSMMEECGRDQTGEGEQRTALLLGGTGEVGKQVQYQDQHNQKKKSLIITFPPKLSSIFS